MGSHPINLTLRFLLEISALIAIGVWAWHLSESPIRFISAFGLPIIFAAIWGIFAVPNDPSRSGKAPIIVPGLLRLIIELGVFAFAAWTVFDMGNTILSLIFVALVLIHYIISYDRIIWLIKH